MTTTARGDVPTQTQDVLNNKHKAQPLPYFLILPAIIILAALTGYPVVQLLINSFQKYGRAQVFGAPPEVVGFENYERVLTDSDFWVMLGRTVLFMIAAVALTIVIGTLISLLMMRLNKGFRMLVSIGLLLSWAMPALTATLIWGWMFDTKYGVINYLMSVITGNQSWIGYSWLLNPFSFFVVLTIIIVWGAVPFVSFTLYGGLTQVSSEMIEAAAIDGASAVQRFFKIQVPQVRSIFIVLIVLSIIWDLNLFVQVNALLSVGGDPLEVSTYGVWIYRTGTAGGDLGLSSAAAVIMVIIMLIISGYYVRQIFKEEV
jgi:N,N'-diacetylchitobiose transport system permease protein